MPYQEVAVGLANRQNGPGAVSVASTDSALAHHTPSVSSLIQLHRPVQHLAASVAGQRLVPVATAIHSRLIAQLCHRPGHRKLWLSAALSAFGLWLQE